MTRICRGLCVSFLHVCLIFAAGGCFDEIIPNPGATAASESSGSTMTTAETATVTATETATSTATTMEPDVDDSDSSSGGSSSSGGADSLDGLCSGLEHDCEGESWKLAPCDDCESLSAIGECVLTDLADVAGGMFTTLRCEPDCIREHYTLRPGAPEVMIESKLLGDDDEPVEIVGRQICTRVDDQYFADCVANYTPECSDPATWFTSCADFEATECPFEIGS